MQVCRKRRIPLVRNNGCRSGEFDLSVFTPGPNVRWPHIAFAVVLLPIGLFLAGGGGWLVALGGSAYYLLAGLMCLGSAGLIYRGKASGIWLYGTLIVGTALWSIWDVGLDFWAVFPRLAGPVVLGLWLAMPFVWRPLVNGNNVATVSTRKARLPIMIFLVALAGVASWYGTGPSNRPADVHGAAALSSTVAPGLRVPADARMGSGVPGADDWTEWGRAPSGDRFVPFEEIAPGNVSRLEHAWTYRTGGAGPNQATPLQVGDTLYVCTRDNVIVALDAETGRERWQYNPVLTSRANGGGCRGVSFHHQRGAPVEGSCKSRIILATRDARLIAVDARDGQPCSDFGVRGEVDLRKGMGDDRLGFQYNTSPAAVVNDVIVVGAAIYDGQTVGEPSGVVRGYDAASGAFRWAWDMGRPGDNREPGAGETYTRGTPNVWSVMSADPANNLVFLPVGNATPDYFGGHRTPEMEKYASSIVALDTRDGSVRWHFQTTHHDIWDYDVPAQPVLVDFPTPTGPVPAVIQPTKRGEFFVFNRLTGEQLVKVEERPVPGGAAKGDRTSKTQPFTVGMPTVTGPALRESDMWGLTPLDQLMCRIMFRRSRYDGQFTPPSLQGTIVYPGVGGGTNWGSVSIDRARGIMMAYSQRMPFHVTLIPRDDPRAKAIAATGPDGRTIISPGVASPQHGVPYATQNGPFLSPLQVPCNRPPYGLMTAIDLKSRKILWERPIGTARNSGPFGQALGLPFEMGVPANGGSLVTRSGLTFYAGSQDGLMRAYDSLTGREVWKVALPVGAQATPMSYVSPQSGTQFIAVTAGGAVGTVEQGDYIVAYRLPKNETRRR